MPFRNKADDEIKLQVLELEKSRSGRSLCYVDQNIVEKMGWNTGTIIEIAGKKKTAGIVVSASTDKGTGAIRLDELQRLNAGVAIGEYVIVRLANAIPAEEIELTPTKPDIDLKKQSDSILAKLIDKPVVSGDIVEVLGAIVRKTYQDDPMSQIVNIMNRQKRRPTLGKLRLVVENTHPPNRIVKISRETRIKVNKRIAILNVKGELITFNEIGGLTETIKIIREMIEIPFKHPESYQKFGIEPPKGILFNGPSGTGKTLMAKALSQESNAYFITINGLEIMSKYWGESEERLREIFKEAEEHAPSIIFIDDIDSIAPRRTLTSVEVGRRVVSQLFSLMDSLSTVNNVIVIGATNKLELLDPSLFMESRFCKIIPFDYPDEKARLEILKIHTKNMILEEDVHLEELAKKIINFTGADIRGVCREAVQSALRRVVPRIDLDSDDMQSQLLEQGKKITNEDFSIAIENVSRLVNLRAKLEAKELKKSNDKII